MRNRLILSIFCFVFMVTIAVGDVPNTVNLPRGQCTWYAHLRAQEAGWQIQFDKPYDRHAVKWWEKVTNAEQSTEPKVGAVMVLNGWDQNPYGHVAYVEKLLEGKKFLITHANSSLGFMMREVQGVKVYQSVCERTDKGVSILGSKRIFSVRGFLCQPKPDSKSAAQQVSQPIRG